MAEKVRDLRSALERLRNMPGQLAETDVEVDPMALRRRGRDRKASVE